MRMHNGNFPQWMERLSYLVSIMATNELATQAKKNFNFHSILSQFSANFHLFDESCRWALGEH